MNHRYPIVLLDAGDTILGPRTSFGDVYSAVLDELGLPLDGRLLQICIAEVAHEIAGEIEPGVDRYRQFPGGQDEYWQHFSSRVLERATGAPISAEIAAGAVGKLGAAFLQPAAWQVFDDVVPALQALQADGVRLGIVSNWDSRLPHLLEQLELSSYFDYVGVSHLEGFEKPDPRLFEVVLGQMKIEHRNVLHVGDVPELDRAGADRAGIDSLLVDRYGRLARTHGAHADLSALPRIARDGL